MRRAGVVAVVLFLLSTLLSAVPVAANDGAGKPAKLQPKFLKPMPTPKSASAYLGPPLPTAPPAPASQPAVQGAPQAPVPTEGWTAFSHWIRNGNGSVTSQL